MLLFLLAVVWVLLWAVCLFDILRRRDLGTGSKVLWALVVLLLPIVGLLVYVVVRPADATGRLGDAEAASQDERVRGRHPV
jgi:phospholipase D-like protein